MSLTILLIAQASATLGTLEAFDLRAVPQRPCASGGEEIVVCGRTANDDAYRIRPLPPSDFESKPLRAQADIGGGNTLGVGTEQMESPGGVVSNRVMLKLMMKF